MQPAVNVNFQSPPPVWQPVPTPPVCAPPPPVVPVYPEGQPVDIQQAYSLPKKRRKPSPPPAPPVTTLLVTEEKGGGMMSAAELGVIGGKSELRDADIPTVARSLLSPFPSVYHSVPHFGIVACSTCRYC